MLEQWNHVEGIGRSFDSPLFDNDEDQTRYKYCPVAKDSWCKFQSDKLNGIKIYKNSINILQQLMVLLNQYTNESLYNLIWTWCRNVCM